MNSPIIISKFWNVEFISQSILIISSDKNTKRLSVILTLNYDTLQNNSKLFILFNF
jgi:hypothetical protein